MKTTPERAAKLMKRATAASVTVATILIAVKLVAWMITDSVSLLSSVIDSAMDVLASLVNFIAVRHAIQPADPEHRFGHGKAEPLAALAQAAFISGTGVFLVVEAAHRLSDPRPIEQGAVGIGVMGFSIVLTAILVVYQRYVIRKTSSTVVHADSLHYTMDVLVNGSVIVAILLATRLDWGFADPIFAIGIAGYIMYNAWKIGRRALDQLMDRELPNEARERIKKIVLDHPAVVSMHDLRTRRSGVNTFIQLHIEMDGALSLSRAHAVSDKVEAAILEAFPDAEVIIHSDPEGLEKPPSLAMQ
ncbi:MAG: cation diffusion facilitator family transporter [Proteobacteria bacterium]|nr:cation diffusion facilitator family transporter [Pseudomonadota bacterium]